MNKIIVIGADHHNTLGVIESLGEKGLYPYVIIYTPYKKCYVPRSKFVKNAWSVNNETGLVQIIRNNFNDTKKKTVIISTNDITADILDRNYKFINDICYISSVKDFGTLSNVMSKEYMSNLAREVGLNVPPTWIMNDRYHPQDIDYPVITKAISSVAGTKSNIKVCKNRNDLKEFVQLQKNCSIIQIQKYIEKEFEFQLLGVSLNEGKDVIIPGRTHIDRPNGLDNTFFLRFDKCENSLKSTIDKSIEFVKRTQYTGLFSIEFLRDKKTGKDYFTEMNFRNDGNAYVVTKAGTNLPYILYLSQIGSDYKNELINSSINETYIVPEVYYFTRLLAKEFTFNEWIKNMKKANCCTTFFRNDKKPFIWFLIIAVCKRLNKINVYD